MKRKVSIILFLAIALMFVACNKEAMMKNEVEHSQENQVGTTVEQKNESISEENGFILFQGREPVELEIVTTIVGNDGNSKNYIKHCKLWEKMTKNKVFDKSASADESFKTRVLDDFASGSEPDVLFFFNGADADRFIEAGKVVSLEEIREVYPSYASNLDLDRIKKSKLDGKIYAIPVNGYWEAMYVNLDVLKASGVTLPQEGYTWDVFLEDCEKIKDAGYVPIAAALGSIPHYWWEYAIFNHTGSAEHLNIPTSIEDENAKAWVAGMEDVKLLYEKGYFPRNTNTTTDEVTFDMFLNNEAAFVIDGSWKLGAIVQNCQTGMGHTAVVDENKLKRFTVTFAPGTDKRKPNELIGGTSMGYYITRKAWEDPEKRAAAVSFVSYMTSDQVVPEFAQHTTNALKKPPLIDQRIYNSLQNKAMEMLAKSISYTEAVQDIFQGDCRESTFAGMSDIVTGRRSAESAVEEGLSIYKEQVEQMKEENY